MSKSFRKLFGERVRHYRNINGYSQEKLSEMVGFSPNTISYIETGKNNISFGKIPIFAKALNIKSYQLFIDTFDESDTKTIDKINELLKAANCKQLGIIFNIIKDILDT